MRCCFKVFRGLLKTWNNLFLEAADFTTTLGPERLITVSHSEDHNEAVITVWYWGTPEKCPHCDYDLTGNESGRCPECGVTV